MSRRSRVDACCLALYQLMDIAVDQIRQCLRKLGRAGIGLVIPDSRAQRAEKAPGEHKHFGWIQKPVKLQPLRSDRNARQHLPQKSISTFNGADFASGQRPLNNGFLGRAALGKVL